MIYFVQAVDGGPVKIGTTRRLKMRLPNVARERGCKLRVLGVMEGDRAQEKALHLRFAASRCDGEWFNVTEELTAFIAANAKDWQPSAEPAGTLNIAASAEWSEWIRAAAKKKGIRAPELIDRAIYYYAREEGLGAPPKR